MDSRNFRNGTLLLLLAALALSASCGGSGGASSSGAPPSPSPQTLGSVVDTVVLADMARSKTVGISVAVAKAGTILYTQGYGSAALASNTPMPATAVFQVGSITKQFTASIIMKLQEQGQLSVDDLLVTYLPQYGFPTGLTIRELLNQTSGLTDYVNLPDYTQWQDNGVDESTVLTQVAAAGLHLTPGVEYEYCNSNYFILGAIIEAVTKQPYATNVSQMLLQPLGLTNTFYELPPANLAPSSYDVNSSPPALSPEYPNRSAPFAAGALSSNVADLVKWDHLLTTGKVVTPASFQQMITPPPGVYSPDGVIYGFGLVIDNFIGRPDIWHDGEIPDFETANAIFLDDGFTVVALANSVPFDSLGLVDDIINAVCVNSPVSANC